LTAAQHRINFGLAFLAPLSFAIAYFTARAFTTINPDTVVERRVTLSPLLV